MSSEETVEPKTNRKLSKNDQVLIDFFTSKNLLDPYSADFGLTTYSKQLHNDAGEAHEDNPPFVLFTSCPITLLHDIDVKSENFRDWLKKNSTIKIKDIDIHYLKPHNEKFDLDSFILNDDYNGRIRQYVEFHENGFVEHGFSFPLIYDHGEGNPPAVNLGRTTIAFWLFLCFIKMYYARIGFSNMIDVRLIIRNSDVLTLDGFRGKTANGGTWSGAYDYHHGGGLRTSTHHKNVLIKKIINVNDLADSKIKELVKIISNKIANAYDLDSAKCYNHDGTFNFEEFIDFNNY